MTLILFCERLFLRDLIRVSKCNPIFGPNLPLRERPTRIVKRYFVGIGTGKAFPGLFLDFFWKAEALFLGAYCEDPGNPFLP
jgi:hypothetical protein